MKRIRYIDEFESVIYGDQIYSVISTDAENSCNLCLLHEECDEDVLRNRDGVTICCRLVERSCDVTYLTNSTVNIDRFNPDYSEICISTFNSSLYSSKYIMNKVRNSLRSPRYYDNLY